MIIDTHSHLNFKAYENDREEVIRRTQKEGVICIDIGTKYETSKRAVELAEKYENIFASVGMHPIHIKTDLLKIKTDSEEGAFTPFKEEFEKEKYLELAKSPRVVAIGEIGLDYYYRPKSKTKLGQFKEAQKKVLSEQLEMAKELDLPVIFHCRMAHQDLIGILKDMPKIRGVIHCFTGSWQEAQQYIKLGFYIGINGIIDKLDLREVIKKTPLDMILTETDCPYLTPLSAVALIKAGPEGLRNEPIFVKYVISKIAEIKNIGYNEVAEKTLLNAKKIFNWVSK